MIQNKEVKLLHDVAEQTRFAQRLATGNISITQYANYLNSLMRIFETIESSDEFYIPNIHLYRLPILVDSINNIQYDYGPLEIFTLESTEEYHYYINGCYNDKERNSHVYLNYMPLLMGGSIIKNVIPFSNLVYTFTDRSQCIGSIRTLELDENQIIAGFKFHIRIMEDLEKVTEEYAPEKTV